MPDRRVLLRGMLVLLLALAAALVVPGGGTLWAQATAEPTTIQAVVAAEGAEGAATTGLRDAAESCANSFTADTPVLMADGKEEPIADVKVGDKVLATDPETGRSEPRPVGALIRHSGKHTLVDLTFDDGSKITTTDHHLFWDASTLTFTDAINLHVGDRVLSAHARTLTIGAEHIYDRDLTAYNLQIDGIHTYYAGTTPVLVHNSCESDADGLAHVADRHLPRGSDVDPNAGIFDAGSDLEGLSRGSHGQIGIRQSEGGHDSIMYTVRGPGVVGTNGSGMATNIYRIFRDPFDGSLITMFPR